jgi:tetratricopeptide (TPR) repeat protein
VLDEHKSSDYFNYIDSLSTNISQTATVDLTKKMLLIRAVAYCEVQNYESAIYDLSTYLGIDSLSVLALWQRAVCQSKINQFQASEGTNIDLKTANVLGDMMAALRLAPKNVYLYYNRATLYALRKDYRQAVEDYTRAVDLEPAMAEAYYNRGLCHIFAGEKEKGIRDLSKAGEMGLYTAYSIIKRYR